ncbi:amidohydrolase family protein [uncultured Merdimonas sp.]|uniref:amidohydrolase family protein n=1 Tax=uncultured Merdimonas sp. TaxID=2023269 RepID=UPI00320B5E40
MVIDFHTHIFPDQIAERTLDFLKKICQTTPSTLGTAKDQIRSAKEAGVDLSVSLPAVTKPSQVESVNRFACGFQEGPILSFGGIHPACENYKEILKGIRDAGLKGIKLHPDYQDTCFNDIRYKRILSFASELGLIVSVHAGLDPKCPEDIHCTPKMALEVIREVEPEKLVLAHLGGNQCWDQVEELLVGENVYFDTAVVFGKIPEDQFVRIVRNHGADKILFGTDSPWAGQKEFVRYLSECSLSEQEKEQIFSGNACRLLELPVQKK